MNESTQNRFGQNVFRQFSISISYEQAGSVTSSNFAEFHVGQSPRAPGYGKPL